MKLYRGGKMIRKALLWLVFHGPYLGPLGPWLFGLAIGHRGKRIK
jgi:hypothetical protein